ncbi:MAG: 3-phosphoshikimate 1-carboxyvinyltransferase [Gemmatimonadota bacterium]|uniref:3-phosphoshikimate 1-carboxyvinyltransferase n=1 Tax=Candidatus Palauibacter scopulicola TaxID=3056741 RepID=UPI002381DD2E|nr:3-phosphoshikimate 1-carboxyvinyltransferase [Candidatus Palauibacter scopulicola]MDE2663998.1 3-phosphoshikimate 1-carboxyvinyltransferase [Candidatus Palauibacter scopulicola]
MRVPGDKSISHRAALIAPLASSPSVVRGLSDGVDVRASVRAMQRLGAAVECTDEERGLTIRCAGGGLEFGLAPRLDCGNSGTTARLLAGILAGSGAAAVLDGDPSLRSRPMRRVIYPLQAMGARIEYDGEPERLPVRLHGRATGALRTLRHRGRVASAQVKSAVLLAGVLGRVRVEVSEPALSRDHTERMLAAMGVPIAFDPERMGAGEVRFDPSGWEGGLEGLRMTVPGDPSSAAFLIGASLLGGRAVRVEAVAANAGRIGFLSVLEEMGARVDRDPEPAQADEPLETWTVHPPDGLRAFSIGGDLIPRVVDEIPLLAVLAARARGRSEIRDAAELRVKESDRLAVLARTLGRLGVVVEERADGLTIRGRAGRLRGDVETRGDHRIAMAFGVLDAAGDADLRIDDRACVDVSYPGFWEAIEPFRRRGRRARSPRTGRVIAVDGPAASGKSSTARSVARRLGFVHVNSGLLYRAITRWALDRGIAEDGPSIEAAAPGLEIDLVPAGDGFDVSVEGTRPGPGLETPEVTARVSAVSMLPAVREVVLERLRRAGRRHDIVCDGRDIGTAVFPGADLKVFLVAEARERARRRLRQRGAPLTDDEVERETRRLDARDRLDRSRPLSPLRRASDAIEIDTTSMSPKRVVDAILELAAAAFR